MKNIYYVTFCLLFFAFQVFSQVNFYYYPIQSGTTNNLSYIYRIGTNNMFITGANGTLLKSTNSGIPVFNTEILGTSYNLNGMMLRNNLSTMTYFIFGNNGTLYSSSNSGLNWLTQNSGVTSQLNAGSVVTGDSVQQYKYLIAGSGGTIIYKMFVGGTGNWISLNGVTTSNLKSVYFIGKVGWIAGSSGTILKSINAGMNWAVQPTGTSNDINSIYFANTSKGIAVGNGGIILRTTNGGATWVQASSGTTQILNQVTAPTATDSINFFAIGNTGTVLKSTNGGLNWTSDIFAPNFNFNSGTYINNDLYVLGESGKIYRRTLDTIYHNLNPIALSGNNIFSLFSNTGIFDQDIRNQNTPGFEWPNGSGKHAIFTAGINIAAKVNNQLRMSIASYHGEYSPGYCVNGIFQTNANFKFYKVSRGDNSQTCWDWANWGLMVPFGAPFIDVNNNGIYEAAIDTPGVRNAKETIFICLTDADSNSHTAGEGFGGGTKPLYAELHMTAWEYDSPAFLANVQFISCDIINKSLNTWNAVKTGIVSDPDLGEANDDYIGCDTLLNLGYCYNGNNNDATYGLNPPAVGFTLLRSPLNRSVTPNIRLKMTSFVYFTCTSCSPPPCEADPNGEPLGAYYMLTGLKKDSTSWLDPTQNPPRRTRFTYTGDPETNAGWTEVKGSIGNCNKDTTGVIYPTNPPGDRRLVLGSGANNFSIIPGESQKIVIAQLIARGNSNLNSVTRLKWLCDSIRNFYEIHFPIGITKISGTIPDKFILFQNYPNPFNPTTNIKYQIAKNSFVTLKVYDILGREVETLINEFQNAGTYETQFPINSNYNLSSGIYFYRIVAGDYSETKKLLMLK